MTQIGATETGIADCRELHFAPHEDARGRFVKTIHAADFASLGLSADFRETYHTVSGAGVLRGMHLQLPPSEQAKLVYCIAGRVMDVHLDLRRGSPSFGRFAVVELSGQQANGVYLPAGVAHGFYVREAPATVVYHVTAEYDAAADAGVRWDSFGAPWPDRSPVVSARDAALPAIEGFRTPFEFAAGGAARAATGGPRSVDR